MGEGYLFDQFRCKKTMFPGDLDKSGSVGIDVGIDGFNGVRYDFLGAIEGQL